MSWFRWPRRWVDIKPSKFFSLRIPRGCEHGWWGDDDDDYRITLDTDPPTDVLIGCWDFRPEDPADRRAAARTTLIEFINDSVAKVLERDLSEWQLVDLSQENLFVAQAFVPVSLDVRCKGDSRWWLARVYVPSHGRHFFLIHWNGPFRYLNRCIWSIFNSFGVS